MLSKSEASRHFVKSSQYHDPSSPAAPQDDKFQNLSTNKLLIQEIIAVKRVTFDRTETSAGDHLAQPLLGCGSAAASRGDDVFFNQNAANVVAPEAQRNLANLVPRREPRCLHVLNVVEINAADRQRFQIGDCRDFFLNKASERGVFTLEEPRYESGKAASLFLQPPNALQVVDPMLQRFAAAEHHGRRGA